MELCFSEFKLGMNTAGITEEVDKEVEEVSPATVEANRNDDCRKNSDEVPEVMEAPEEVVATSKYSMLEKLLDGKQEAPTRGCEFRLFDDALKEFSESSYTARTSMLLNYDQTKYMAVPVDERRKNLDNSSSLLPISIIGYNYIDINRACVKPRDPPKSNEPKEMSTIFLKCNEKMPVETEETSNFHSAGPYNCTICLQKFFTKEYLHCHMIKSHSIKLASNAGKCLGYVPPLEGKDLVSFEREEDTSVQNPRFRCIKCPKSYTYIRNLKKHEKAVHNMVGANGGRVLTQSALNCFRIFSYQCRICQERFVDEGALALHTKLHASTCQVCHKVFGTQRGLKLHCAIHFGNQGKQFGCQFCNKRYSHARSLKHHLKQHTGSESTMEAQPQFQPEENEPGSSQPLLPFRIEAQDMDIVSYTFGAVEEAV